MRGCRVYEWVLLVEASRFNLTGLFLLIDNLELAIEDIDAIFGDDYTVSELGVPLNSANIWHAQLIHDSFGTKIVHEESVVGCDQDFTEWSWENILNLSKTFFDDGPLAWVWAIKAANKDLSGIAVERADAILTDEDAGLGILATFL